MRHIVGLADPDALLSQQVVGGDEMEIEIRQQPFVGEGELILGAEVIVTVRGSLSPPG
jgi:hypothetical protein